MTALSTSNMASIARRRYGPSEMQLRLEAARDAAHMTVRCLHCPGQPVIATGPALEVRLHAAEHRKTEHGWKPRKRRKR